MRAPRERRRRPEVDEHVLLAGRRLDADLEPGRPTRAVVVGDVELRRERRDARERRDSRSAERRARGVVGRTGVSGVGDEMQDPAGRRRAPERRCRRCEGGGHDDGRGDECRSGGYQSSHGNSPLVWVRASTNQIDDVRSLPYLVRRRTIPNGILTTFRRRTRRTPRRPGSAAR